MHACMHAYIHTYIHTYIHSDTHLMRQPLIEVWGASTDPIQCFQAEGHTHYKFWPDLYTIQYKTIQ